MGRVPEGPQPDILDFYRFTSPGARLFSDAIPAPAAYFSIDGGVKAIADYGVHSDPSDFLDTYDTPPSKLTPEDPFDEYYDAKTKQTLTSVDIDQLRVLGFNVSTTLASAGLAFDAWNGLASSGGADHGGFGFEGNIVDARDVWGVSVARSSPIGHGVLSS